jgi:imidazoleglycerol phosphate dehydratase HisB
MRALNTQTTIQFQIETNCPFLDGKFQNFYKEVDVPIDIEATGACKPGAVHHENGGLRVEMGVTFTFTKPCIRVVFHQE